MSNALFPKKGIPWPELERVLDDARGRDIDWRAGRQIMTCYQVDDELRAVADAAYAKFLHENALLRGDMGGRGGSGFFPSLAKVDDEIIGMALEILNAPEGAAGATVTGGTEAILVAAIAARAWARAHRSGIERPRLLVPRTAHPAFNKAAYYFDLAITRVPQGEDYRADVDAMADALDDDVILMVGSAPCYPFGVIDPIAELAELAAARDVWFHVDACVGGFVAPFVKELGYPVPDFDFAVPGVWSISADLHKYGMTPRNASLLLFREAALREHAQFYFDDWPYGSYGTVTIGGSRTGGSLAAAWAVMRNLGQHGYLAVAKTIMETRQRFMDGISEIDGLHVIGEPHTALICFGSDAFDIYAVADAMRDLGWALGRGKDPASIHLSVAPIHVPAVDEFLAHLRTAVADVRCGRIVSEGRGAVYV